MTFQKMPDDPGICEHVEILASLTHPPVNKYEIISLCRIFRPMLFITEEIYKTDIH